MTTKPVPNDIALYFTKINKIGFYCGLPNFWIDEPNVPKSLVLFFTVFRKVTNALTMALIVSEYVAIFTQNKLKEKQHSDLLMFCFSHPMFYTYIVIAGRYRERIKDVLFKMVITLKVTHNDRDVEREMIRKSKFYSTAFSSIFITAILLYGFDSIMQVISGEGTFTTLITCWPDVEDRSTGADYARIAVYFLWWIFMLRVCAVYILVIPLTICLSHQFKNLKSYFYSLHAIFDEDKSQVEKEIKYEKAFKAGVKMHSHTLWCTNECQVTCGMIFSIQILTNVTVLVMLMMQMMNADRTLVNVFPIVFTGAAMLASTGFIMCSAGDVTLEAAALPSAMYFSGWHSCRVTSRRVRRLLTITMTLGQRPVVMLAFGIVKISYESYLSIVKSSYSVFSVLY